MKINQLKQHKFKIILSALAIAAVATPATIFAINHFQKADNSYATEEDTEQAVQDIPHSTSAMPAPFVDQNFYDCVEAEFINEFPGEPIDPSGLTDAQLAKIKTLTCNGSGKPDTEKITNASGLEKLSALLELDVYSNQLASIDIANNTALTMLNVSRNRIQSLDVTHNINLTYLNIDYNFITSIDISHNTALQRFFASGSSGMPSLTSLDVTHNTALTELDLSDNIKLTSLDVTHNTALTELNLSHCQLTSLDITKNLELKKLNVLINNLTSLDVSHNTALTSLEAGSNHLVSLDTSHNPALVELGIGNYDTLYPYERNQITSLDLSNNSALEDFDATKNKLASLDLTKNTKLSQLYLEGNQLTSLDVSHNSQLYVLRIYNNNLASLDLRQNSSLRQLQADDILLRTNIVGQKEGSNRNFDLTALKFIGDGFYYNNTIYNTDNYTFNEGTRTLSVNNLLGTGGYAQIVQTAGDTTKSPATYKLQLPKIYKLHYDLNGGTSSVIPDSECESMDGYCDFNVTETEPTRDGYKFLGWADSSSSTTGDYHKGETYKVTDPDTEKTLYAIWAPAHVLNFDANHGMGAPTSQICYPDTTDGSCSITIPLNEPARDSYYFFGWAKTATAADAEFQPKDEIALSSKEPIMTLYAVWGEYPPEPTPTPDQPATPEVAPTPTVPNTGVVERVNNISKIVIAPVGLIGLFIIFSIVRVIRSRRRTHIKFD